MSELSFPASSPSRRLPLAPSPHGVAWAFSYLLAPSLRLSRSLALTPYQRIARRSRLPYYDSSTALGARSIHGIASWFSEGSRLSPTTPDGAPLARSLSRCVFAHWLTHGARLALRPSSRSLSLSLHSPSSSPLFPPPPLSPPRPATTPYTLPRGCGASQLHGARQLRNNNNAVRRCVASCGARHRNATPVDRA